MVHTQIVCAVAVDGQRLGFPKGVRGPPRPYMTLASRCMDPNPAARPTFAEVIETIKRILATLPERTEPSTGATPSTKTQVRVCPGGLMVASP